MICVDTFELVYKCLGTNALAVLGRNAEMYCELSLKKMTGNVNLLGYKMRIIEYTYCNSDMFRRNDHRCSDLNKYELVCSGQ